MESSCHHLRAPLKHSSRSVMGWQCLRTGVKLPHSEAIPTTQSKADSRDSEVRAQREFTETPSCLCKSPIFVNSPFFWENTSKLDKYLSFFLRTSLRIGIISWFGVPGWLSRQKQSMRGAHEGMSRSPKGWCANSFLPLNLLLLVCFSLHGKSRDCKKYYFCFGNSTNLQNGKTAILLRIYSM